MMGAMVVMVMVMMGVRARMLMVMVMLMMVMLMIGRRSGDDIRLPFPPPPQLPRPPFRKCIAWWCLWLPPESRASGLGWEKGRDSTKGKCITWWCPTSHPCARG